MKTKQEQIEEIAKVIHKVYITRICKDEYTLAEEIYKAGYRKATEVIDEFVERLKKVIHERDYIGGYAEIGLCEEIDELAAEMQHEVGNENN